MTKFAKDNTPSWAASAIQITQKKRLASLDLTPPSSRVSKLTTIPPEVFELSWLQALNLGNNTIVTVPKDISRLRNLQSLKLNGNQIKNIPGAIGELKELQELNLSDNHLVNLTDDLSQLTKLFKLRIGNNELTILPSGISKLKNLRELSLHKNKCTTFPEWVISLPKLELLELDVIYKSPPLEVLRNIGSHGGNSLQFFTHHLNKLRLYFQQLEEGKDFLFEAKLLIVGEPGAGKTSLTRKLLDPTAQLPAKDESTEGIDVYSWTFPLQQSIPQDPLVPKFRVNIWDFGGQEIYHATHQFFLTRRSLYIVVADAREQKADFYHWLDLIEHLSDRSPALIFNNEVQNRHWAINEQQLKAYFPETFQKPFAFNLADDEAGLAFFRETIQEKITNLPHVGDVLPQTWIKVRRALEEDFRATVSWQDFFELCRKNGFAHIDDALHLSGYLHDIGVILHFQDDPLLKNVVILKPEWGTDAVYRVLDNDEVIAAQGHFSKSDLHRIWNEDEYAMLHDELLALMMKFQLCYAIPDQENRYIAPQLLGEQPPTYEWEKQNNLHLRYKYEAFMPKGIVTRFIVAMHPYIAGQKIVWRTGVVLVKDETVAEITEIYPRREIQIRVVGKKRRDFLTVIMYELDKLHKPFHRIKFDKLIPCNCKKCRNSDEPHFYRFEVLQMRLDHGKNVIECDRPPFEQVQIAPLLDDVFSMVEEINLPKLLLSLNDIFNKDEFIFLCLELNVNYENLPGDGLIIKKRELLLFMERNGRLPELINLLRQKRPNFNW